MPHVSDHIMIDCPADKFLAFVMDIKQYATIDSKLGRFSYARLDGNRLRFKCQAIMPGIPTPPLSIVVDAERDGDRIDVRLAPRPHNLLFHQLMHFRAGFQIERISISRITVRRYFAVDLRPPLRRLFEPTLRRTLPEDIALELRGAKALMEQHQHTIRRQAHAH